jgi:hypothetical protein
MLAEPRGALKLGRGCWVDDEDWLDGWEAHPPMHYAHSSRRDGDLVGIERVLGWHAANTKQHVHGRGCEGHARRRKMSSFDRMTFSYAPVK